MRLMGMYVDGVNPINKHYDGSSIYYMQALTGLPYTQADVEGLPYTHALKNRTQQASAYRVSVYPGK